MFREIAARIDVRAELVRQANDASTDDAGFTGVGP